MKLVFFCHPSFMRSQSMPRFARMIGGAMQAKGYEVAYWAPQAWVHALFDNTRLAKWAGYVDQYLVFPLQVKARLLRHQQGTLFVFCDQALGPWVPLVKHLPHVVHAHDLLALRSALGQIPQNPTSSTGRLYQRYIRRGFRQAQHFISVSKRTQSDLVEHGQVQAQTSCVVYNGLNYPYKPVPRAKAFQKLSMAGLPATEDSMILHVGGGQWYKNTAGVIHLYARYAARHDKPLPLWMISPHPSNPEVLAALKQVPAQGCVLFYQGIDNAALEAAYSVARAFLFPSLAEGFGWPIVEAQACGCPVITTDDSPMNEIAGPLAKYLPMLKPGDDMSEWAEQGADVLEAVLQVDGSEQLAQRQSRIAWAGQFTTHKAIEGYLSIYQSVFALES
ncbi:glycosyltransferase [Aquabacterium sp.]|uniref:glycosyltransferase n=1 Tax=Aquabacterium sp. TaxID=1872578 RepID=UPI0019B67723|nr:glycosyltransferase [Aquabacterium sp.]MBC7702010.1 glycosyltransferase [Aquabacterium sp.]